MCTLLASASRAPKREYFKSDFCIYHFVGTFSLQDSNIMTSVLTQLLFIIISLLLFLPVVEAVEAKDAILFGVVLSITGICACVGVYA
ncbi:small integral membrane protein 30-like [Marmota marmota marmota]|uniref:small integral membrane protein 30-like n=2 Tax=Marmota TaxID=9992 RepID=UPI002093AFCA|nr:small integral membrane protein 30-like [Marmota marmota marmota]